MDTLLVEIQLHPVDDPRQLTGAASVVQVGLQRRRFRLVGYAHQKPAGLVTQHCPIGHSTRSSRKR